MKKVLMPIWLKRLIGKIVLKTVLSEYNESHKTILILMHLNRWGESGWKLINCQMDIFAEYDDKAVKEIREFVRRLS